MAPPDLKDIYKHGDSLDQKNYEYIQSSSGSIMFVVDRSTDLAYLYTLDENRNYIRAIGFASHRDDLPIN